MNKSASYICLFGLIVLAACGSSSSPVASYTIGGTISNMLGTTVLQNNSGDELIITTEDGEFTFATAVEDGAGYAVTILTQPDYQTCTLSNETGTVTHANVTDVILGTIQKSRNSNSSDQGI